MNRLSYENAPRILVKPPGPKSLELLDIQDKYETKSRIYTQIFRMAVDDAKGSTVKDVDGNIYIDWFSGISVLNLGHSNPIVIDAIQNQLNKIDHINEVPTEARVQFLKTLESTLPGKLRNNAKIMFTVTGGDACEAAVSLARYITKKKIIIAFSGSYHGIAGEIASATANYHYREYENLDYHNFYHLPYPYKYRFPIKVNDEDISKVVIDMLENILKDNYSGIGPVGGVLVEPIQGEGGYIVPPDDFLPMLREVTEKYSIPLIADEVQSGVGRTGKIWASEHWSITPDIMCISKSIGGGIPASMIAYKKEYDEFLPQGFHLGTYRGNPLALAAGNAILNYLQNSEILNRVQEKGKYIVERFNEMSYISNYIGDVRGKGFMIGVELVKDRKSKEPATDVAIQLKKKLFEKGLLMHTCGHYGNVMRFMAPLTIEDDLIDKGLEVFENSIKEIGNT
ncbi:aspartate aminotransferase family protein [Acidianus brierleyi]|uniref:Aspartate aminotransferase family protein n=1 Tax=Acidianus brierleyi TaxID=41673 RepID=A0A2U9ICG7_9CREN|nr:aspartate aminotransferase family protein [Acidianus brierleyi]AWR93703.1 aminotransferase class III-fold pyridoxal phosphate-dependent enzyme [Acidianus brierleyi]